MGKKNKEADPDLMGQVYEYDEDALAKVIGLKRRYVQEARESIGNEAAWTLQHGAVIYSREGVAKLLKALGCPADDRWVEELLKDSRVNGEWIKNRSGYRLARVTMIPRNPRIVLAMLIDEPERRVVRVIVRDSQAWRSGMETSVKLVTEPDLYEQTAQRKM